MRTITCPTCGKPFDVEEGAAGPAAVCPACGSCASCGRAESRPPLPLAARMARAGVVVLGSLALGALLALGQRGPRTGPPDATVRAAPPEKASEGRQLDVAHLVERFEKSPPTDIEGWLELREEVAALPQEQQRDPALRPLLEGWLATAEAWADDVAHRLVGDVEFVLSSEDENLFMDLREEDLPAIATIEDARERRWFPPDASADLAAARDAIKQLRAWMNARVEDPAARAAAAYRANMELDEFHGHFDPEVVWQSPFLVFVAGAPRPKDESPETAPYEVRRRREIAADASAILQAVKTEWDHVFGQPLGLADLMAPYGGKEDYPIGVRSYADGHVVGLWIYDSWGARQAVRTQLHVRSNWFVGTTAGSFDVQNAPIQTWPANADPEDEGRLGRRIAHAGVRALMYAHARQQANWRKPRIRDSAWINGICAQLESVTRTESGSWVIEPRNEFLLEEARVLRARRTEKRGGYPCFPLRALLEITDYRDAAREALVRFDLTEPDAYFLFRQQSWMFLHFLRTLDEGAHWPKFLDLVREWALLPRGASAGYVIDRVFPAGELDELQERWPAFVDDLLGPAPEPPAEDDGK